jgi:hypothetical protein
VPFIAGSLEGIMEFAHHLGGFDVYRVLVAESPFLDAENKAEVLYMLCKLAEPESNCGVVFEIVKFEALEVA